MALQVLRFSRRVWAIVGAAVLAGAGCAVALKVQRERRLALLSRAETVELEVDEPMEGNYELKLWKRSSDAGIRVTLTHRRARDWWEREREDEVTRTTRGSALTPGEFEGIWRPMVRADVFSLRDTRLPRWARRGCVLPARAYDVRVRAEAGGKLWTNRFQVGAFPTRRHDRFTRLADELAAKVERTMPVVSEAGPPSR